MITRFVVSYIDPFGWSGTIEYRVDTEKAARKLFEYDYGSEYQVIGVSKFQYVTVERCITI
jgi:hypothetical protein